MIRQYDKMMVETRKKFTFENIKNASLLIEPISLEYYKVNVPLNAGFRYILNPFSTFFSRYHRRQNKLYPQLFLLAHLKLHSILAVPNLLGYNNIPISYYVQVNSLRLKSSVSFGYTLEGTIYFSVDGSLLTDVICLNSDVNVLVYRFFNLKFRSSINVIYIVRENNNDY